MFKFGALSLRARDMSFCHFSWQKYIHNDVPKVSWIMTWEPYIENGRLKIPSTLKSQKHAKSNYQTIPETSTQAFIRKRSFSVLYTHCIFFICHSSLICSLINIIYLFSCHTVISLQMKNFIARNQKWAFLKIFPVYFSQNILTFLNLYLSA